MSTAIPHTPALAPSNSNIKRLSTIGKPGQTSPSKQKAPAPAVNGSTTVKDVVSPAELCGFVDSLLNQLETRFDEMSEQVLTRMDDMSDRLDKLENTVQDLIHSDIDASSPSPSPAGKR